MKYWSCDFETTTDPEDCRVWLWCARDYDSEYRAWDINIESFIDWTENHIGEQLSFHNLKFDGQFIIDYLLKNGWTWVDPSKKKLARKEMKALVSDMGQWYTLVIGFDKGQVKIVDSFKLLPFKVARIAKDFHLPILKGEIDYKLRRPKGHKPTEEELAYIFNDVDIVAMAMKQMYERGLKKLTIGACALAWYKQTTRHFEHYFPKPDYDHDIRQGYRGGWTFANPIYQGKDMGEGIVLDVNSLYPWVMSDKDCLLPYGAGVWFKGEYKPDKYYPIYIQHLSCQFELKPRHLPTLQVKGDPRFRSTDYLGSSHGCIVDLCLTNVDLELMKEHYNLYNVEYHSGWKFKGKGGIFADYVNFWTAQKIKAKKEHNYAMYIVSKLLLNSLYGKFGTNPRADIKEPRVEESGAVTWHVKQQDPRDPVYLPVAMFVTAWARNKTIRAAQKVIDRFLYADTDSLHLIGTEIPPELEVDKYKLGAWDHEATFKRARYLHAKCYLEEMYAEDEQETDWKGDPVFNEDGTPSMILAYTNKITDKVKNKVTIAGLPADCHDQVTWENFKLGQLYEGKLKPKIVPGGVCLVDIPFEIRRNYIYE